MFNIFQPYATTTLSHKTQFLGNVTAFFQYSCMFMSALFFQAQELPTLFRSITIPSKTFSSQADKSFFQLTRICFLYSMAFQHFLVKLINNLVGQTTDKFTKLISIFKTQRFQSTPFQFHPQNFPVELPFQLKGINLYALRYFTDVQHFSVILNKNLIT